MKRMVDHELDRLRRELAGVRRELEALRAENRALRSAGTGSRDAHFARWEALAPDVRVLADGLGALDHAARSPGLVRASAALPLAQLSARAATRQADDLRRLAGAYPAGAVDRVVIARGDVVRACKLVFEELALTLATGVGRLDRVLRVEGKSDGESQGRAAAASGRSR